MNIVHVSPEFAPLVKVGGLGDVVFSLSKELAAEGHSSSVILPHYSQIDETLLENPLQQEFVLTTPEGNALITWKTTRGIYNGITLYLLKPNHPKRYFDRDKIYGEIDDNDRFILFSCAAALLIEEVFASPIVHLHDWQTALVAPLLFEEFPIVFTIHNIAYQGRCSEENIRRVSLEKYLPSLRFYDREGLYLMKGALEWSGAITTVSPTYAEEIQTPEFGYGFEGVVTHHAPKLVGILNGLDLEYWNPQTDRHVAANFSPHAKDLFEKKEVNKKALFQWFQKPFSNAPLFCSITRLVPQKGPDLIEAGIEYALQTGRSFALSGSTCDVTETQFQKVQQRFGMHDQALLYFGFDEPLAHLIYAAADYILIPSSFEPCGLTQMIALLYGAIPIVTATGGLKDTIVDISAPGGNGIVLGAHTKEAVYEGIERACDIPLDVRKEIFGTMNRARFSWKNSLAKYEQLYESFVSEPL